MSQITLKVTINVGSVSEIRRFAVSSWTDFSREVTQWARIEDLNQVLIQWCDEDGDWITMDSEEEFNDGILSAGSAMRRVRVLARDSAPQKIPVVPKAPEACCAPSAPAPEPMMNPFHQIMGLLRGAGPEGIALLSHLVSRVGQTAQKHAQKVREHARDAGHKARERARDVGEKARGVGKKAKEHFMHLGTVPSEIGDSVAGLPAHFSGLLTQAATPEGVTTPFGPFRLADGLEGRLCHYRVTCDGCGKRNWTGTRHKCAVCPDYDLCGECFIGRRAECHAEHLDEGLWREEEGRRVWGVEAGRFEGELVGCGPVFQRLKEWAALQGESAKSDAEGECASSAAGVGQEVLPEVTVPDEMEASIPHIPNDEDIAEDPTAAAAEEPVAPVAVDPAVAEYAVHLEVLQGMGFADVQQNLVLLKKHGGNLNRVVQALVQ